MKPKPKKTAKKQDNAPAVMTEREKRAALIPTFKDGRIDITQEQLAAMKDVMHTDHGVVLQGAVHAASVASPYRGAQGDMASNIALRMLVELAPQNAVERMLCAQLVASDAAASLCLGIGVNPENSAESKRKYLSLGLQFQGLQVRQIEALVKLRTGGRQHVTVEHVTVEAGAQAVIGNVTRGGGVAGVGE